MAVKFLSCLRLFAAASSIPGGGLLSGGRWSNKEVNSACDNRDGLISRGVICEPDKTFIIFIHVEVDFVRDMYKYLHIAFTSYRREHYVVSIRAVLII